LLEHLTVVSRVPYVLRACSSVDGKRAR
jgi:hypothetical protein